MLRTILLIAILSFFCAIASAQEFELYLVNISGKVVSAESGEPIPYAHIINDRVHGGTTTNVDGHFSINILTDDTLVIRTMGFVDKKFFIEEFPPREFYNIRVNPVRVMLSEVIVTEDLDMKNRLGLPDSKPLDIPIELRGSAFNEKPHWSHAFSNPLSFIHYYTNHDEKVKREMRQTIISSKQWMVFSKHFNLEKIKNLTNLEGAQADKFVIYCNINNRLPFNASQLEIDFQIMDLYFKYLKEQKTDKGANTIYHNE